MKAALGWLGVWVAIGAGLRFWQLAATPLWTDEFATLVFSLGHSFQTVPLNQVLSGAQLLQPLRLEDMGTVGDVVQHLMAESTHPPLFFVLMHGWLRAFSAATGWVDVGLARSLSALCGVLAIPALFGLAWGLLRDWRVAQWAAALMALSPLGIYLCQDARHYTLAILWEIAGLGCGAIALERWQSRSPLPRWLPWIWILVNALGCATHYFFELFLAAQLMVGIGWLYVEFCLEIRHSGLRAGINRRLKAIGQNPARRGVAISSLGTAIVAMVWLPFLVQSRESELIRWALVSRNGFDWLEPILNITVGLITMLVMLPIQNVPSMVMNGFGAITIGMSFALGWHVVQGWRSLAGTIPPPGSPPPVRQAWNGSTHCPRRILMGLLGTISSAIVLFWFLDYGLSLDLTRAFRYSFVYLPSVMLAGAIGLAVLSRRAVSALLLLPLVLSGLTVATHFGYQKVHRPDLVAQFMQTETAKTWPTVPRVIGIAHQTHGQTGRLMGLAWEFQANLQPSKTQQIYEHENTSGNTFGNLQAQGQVIQWAQASRQKLYENTLFYLDHQDCDAKGDPRDRQSPCQEPTDLFRQQLAALPRPFDLWLINFSDLANLRAQQCVFDAAIATKHVDGYRYQRYRCS